ncbi:hypothetical protein [Parasphingorhabdus sp.]|uniref:hypothetical protein n=1 Tax=Parasphingorhabdus sp. TaxID=2709688 RepID=UPI002F95B8CF
MNFPHKSLTQTSAETDAPASSAHDVLIEHAIARQSLSPSARAYIKRHSTMAAPAVRDSRGCMEDRIRLFADGPSRQGPFVKSQCAHFRPDLLREKRSGDAAEE